MTSVGACRVFWVRRGLLPGTKLTAHTAVFREMCTSRQIFYTVLDRILILPGKALRFERNSLWALRTRLLQTILARFFKMHSLYIQNCL